METSLKNMQDMSDLTMSFRKPIKDVGGTNEFRGFFNSLDENDPFKKEIRDARDDLKEDLRMGEKIPHDRWAEEYKKRGVTNLWVYKMRSGARLIYTII